MDWGDSSFDSIDMLVANRLRGKSSFSDLRKNDSFGRASSAGGGGGGGTVAFAPHPGSTRSDSESGHSSPESELIVPPIVSSRLQQWATKSALKKRLWRARNQHYDSARLAGRPQPARLTDKVLVEFSCGECGAAGPPHSAVARGTLCLTSSLELLVLTKPDAVALSLSLADWVASAELRATVFSDANNVVQLGTPAFDFYILFPSSTPAASPPAGVGASASPGAATQQFLAALGEVVTRVRPEGPLSSDPLPVSAHRSIVGHAAAMEWSDRLCSTLGLRADTALAGGVLCWPASAADDELAGSDDGSDSGSDSDSCLASPAARRGQATARFKHFEPAAEDCEKYDRLRHLYRLEGRPALSRLYEREGGVSGAGAEVWKSDWRYETTDLLEHIGFLEKTATRQHTNHETLVEAYSHLKVILERQLPSDAPDGMHPKLKASAVQLLAHARQSLVKLHAVHTTQLLVTCDAKLSPTHPSPAQPEERRAHRRSQVSQRHRSPR